VLQRRRMLLAGCLAEGDLLCERHIQGLCATMSSLFKSSPTITTAVACPTTRACGILNMHREPHPGASSMLAALHYVDDPKLLSRRS
jgi:hypothetical protein